MGKIYSTLLMRSVLLIYFFLSAIIDYACNLHYPTYDFNDPGYLIITADSLIPSFKEFALSKALRGYDVTIKSVEDIYEEYNSYPDSVERIKRYIYDYYIGMDEHARYVLLGGDDSIIPVRRCYVYLHGHPMDNCSNVPSDLYYVCFGEGNYAFDWNLNGDDKFAQFRSYENQQVMGHPLIHVDVDSAFLGRSMQIARLPIRTKEHVNVYTDKLYKYEHDDYNIDNYHSKILLTGQSPDYRFYLPNGQSAVSYWAEQIRNRINAYGNDYDVSLLFDSSINDSTSFVVDSLKNKLTSGYQLVNIECHGSAEGFDMNDGLFSSDELDSDYLMVPFITTTSCYVNNFTAEPSIGESFIRSPNTSNIFFWGSTDLGYSSKYWNRIEWSVELMFDFYNILAGDETYPHVGDIVFGALGCVDSIYACTEGRWIYLTQTLCGDPDIYINTGIPERVNPFGITIANDIVDLSGRTDACKCYYLCTGFQPGEEGDWNEYTHLNAVYCPLSDSEIFIDGNFVFGLYKEGYVPFRSDKDRFTEVRIQNQVIADYDLRAENFIIGRNIDSEQPSGPITIASGHGAKLNYGQSVTISDSFECPIGSTLEIIPFE